MRQALGLIALGTLAVLLAACVQAPSAPRARQAAGASALGEQGLTAAFLMPSAVPAAVRQAAFAPAQQAADEASRKRQIPFFNLHDAPVALRLGSGADAGYVLSYLGTGQDDADLNLELRALYGAGALGFCLNYSGPTTLARTARGAERPAMPKAARGSGVSFELILGLPGDGVVEAYEAYLNHLGERLRGRYQARPFSFDDAPLVFAVHRGEALEGFLFLNQGNRLVLGERKYADVQSVAFFGTDAERKASYTLIGFNRKTASSTSAPEYRREDDARFGALLEFGER